MTSRKLPRLKSGLPPIHDSNFRQSTLSAFFVFMPFKLYFLLPHWNKNPPFISNALISKWSSDIPRRLLEVVANCLTRITIVNAITAPPPLRPGQSRRFLKKTGYGKWFRLRREKPPILCKVDTPFLKLCERIWWKWSVWFGHKVDSEHMYRIEPNGVGEEGKE